MVNTHVDPTHILADIINTIWDNFGRFWGSKVMNLHLFRLSFRVVRFAPESEDIVIDLIGKIGGTTFEVVNSDAVPLYIYFNKQDSKFGSPSLTNSYKSIYLGDICF